MTVTRKPLEYLQNVFFGKISRPGANGLMMMMMMMFMRLWLMMMLVVVIMVVLVVMIMVMISYVDDDVLEFGCT